MKTSNTKSAGLALCLLMLLLLAGLTSCGLKDDLVLPVAAPTDTITDKTGPAAKQENKTKKTDLATKP